MLHFNKLLLILSAPLLLLSCAQQRMRAIVAESRTVVLDIGHYYHPERGGQGARTPDSRYGKIEECEFWYQYTKYTKKVIEDAGYQCIVCNRGSEPSHKKLAAAARETGVFHVNTPEPNAIYRSAQHPRRMAVGMLSTNFALEQNPAAVVYLHHNSHSDDWQVYNKGGIYCNEVGGPLGFAVANVINQEVYEKFLPNNGVPCEVILRTDGRRGGGDWLNACNESYVPAIITEATFLSNPEHARSLSRKENAIRYAEAVGRGVVNYLQQREQE